MLLLASGHDPLLHQNWVVSDSGGWLLFCSMDKWLGFVFCLCSLTSFPDPRPTVLNTPTQSQTMGLFPWSQWSSLLALVFQVCTYAVSIKLIVVYIKKSLHFVYLSLYFLSVWLWINYWWGRTKINNYLFTPCVFSVLQEINHFTWPKASLSNVSSFNAEICTDIIKKVKLYSVLII